MQEPDLSPMQSKSIMCDRLRIPITHRDLHHYFLQTLTTLSLQSKRLGTEEARFVTDALKINRVRSSVRFDDPPPYPPLAVEIHHPGSHTQPIGSVEGARSVGDALLINQVRSTMCSHRIISATPLTVDTPHALCQRTDLAQQERNVWMMSVLSMK